MKLNEFNNLVDELLEKCKKTLKVKQNEYNLDVDRLAFFKSGKDLTGLSPERTLYMFMYKHIKSLADMVKSEKAYPDELILSKIEDNINYLCLLYALMKDDNLIIEDKKEEK